MTEAAADPSPSDPQRRCKLCGKELVSTKREIHGEWIVTHEDCPDRCSLAAKLEDHP